MLVKSARTVSREFYMEKRVFALCLLHIWLAEGVAKILRCAKRVFMLFTISPQHRGLKHYILYCCENDNLKTA